MLLRGLARRHRLVRILVFELVERKWMRPAKRMVSAIASGKSRNSRAISSARLQMALGIGLQPGGRRLDGGLLADAGQHVLQRAARGMMVQHLVGREQRHLRREREAMQPRQTAPVVAAIEQAGGEPHAIGALCFNRSSMFDAAAASKRCGSVSTRSWPSANSSRSSNLRWHSPFSILAASSAAFAPGEQPAQPAIGGAVARIDQDVRRAVDEDEARADQKFRLVPDFGIFQFGIGAHHAGQRVVVGDADGGKADSLA